MKKINTIRKKSTRKVYEIDANKTQESSTSISEF